MPRQKRRTYLGYPHLVKAYANGSDSLFYDDSDFRAYLGHFRQLVRDKLVKLYGFCLQTDEVRLILKPMRLSLPKLMQRIHGAHTMRINSKHARKGHLFSGRYSSTVFPASQILEAVRAVHLWPVRNGLIRRAEVVPWSSHCAYLDARHEWRDMLSIEELALSEGGEPLTSDRAYQMFIESAVLEADGTGIEEIAPGVGGNSESMGHILKHAQPGLKKTRRLSLSLLARRVSLVLNVSMNQLQSPSRRQDIVMARRLLASVAVLAAERRVSEVSEFIERDKAQVSRLVSQGIDLYDCSEAFRSLFDSIRGNQQHDLDMV